MKEGPRQLFRWAAHSSGVSVVRARDYEPGGEFVSASFYALWDELRASENGLHLGDLLEAEDGRLVIFKYVGFEPAEWSQPVANVAPNEEVAVSSLV